MYKLRIKYQKTGDLRFLSHLDLVRAFERGVRRASLPLSLTQGFSPHPKISFGPPLPVGVSSDSEYADLVIEEHLALEGIMTSLKNAFPGDLCCKEARYIELDSPSLMSLISVASYEISASLEPAVSEGELKDLLDSGLRKSEIQIPVKDGQRTYQIHEIVKDLVLANRQKHGRENMIELNFLGLLPNAGGVRPEALIKKFLSLGQKNVHLKIHRIHRTGLYISENGKLVEP